MPDSLIWGETEYVELWGNGYPQEVFSSTGQMQEATRTYLVDWDARQQALLDFLGYSECLPNTITLATRYLSRQIPHFHADYVRPSDLQPYLYADQVTFEPMGVPIDFDGQPDFLDTITDLETPNYRSAKMTVHYSARAYRILEDWEMPNGGSVYPFPSEAYLDRYVEILSNPAVEYLTLPAGAFTYGPEPVLVDDSASGVTANSELFAQPGKIYSTDDLTILWRQVPRRMVAKSSVMAPILGPAVQQSAFDFALGRVNQEAFLGFPPETLLCLPMEITPWIQADGEMVFDVTFHFKYLRSGHGYVGTTANSANSLVYSQVVVKSQDNYFPGLQTDGQSVYDSYQFAYLFYGYDFTAGQYP